MYAAVAPTLVQDLGGRHVPISIGAALCLTGTSAKAARANFGELRYGEVRRLPLPRTPVNRGKKRTDCRREVYIGYMCGKNIVARTYYLPWRYYSGYYRKHRQDDAHRPRDGRGSARLLRGACRELRRSPAPRHRDRRRRAQVHEAPGGERQGGPGVLRQRREAPPAPAAQRRVRAGLDG